MKKILAIILTIASVFSVMSFTASAEETTEDVIVIARGDADYVFEAGVSQDHIDSFIALCEEDHDCEEAATYGLMCTLFGHKLETSTASTVTHNARTTAPRCLKKTYTVETCSRCDYSTKTLKNSQYISCC